MRSLLLNVLLFVVVSTQLGRLGYAQSIDKMTARTDSTAQTFDKPRESNEGANIKSFTRNVMWDQKALWTEPSRLRESDLQWLVPFSLGTVVVFATDTAITPHLPSGPGSIRNSQRLSNIGVMGLAGTAGSIYLFGRLKDDHQMKETGLLSGEALADSLLATTSLKLITRRDRPTEGDGTGRFWRSGYSFPSEHAAAGWAIASVIAHEYPGYLSKLLAYGTAATVSATRVTGRKHFASDVIVGSALGWYLGRQVYRAHSTDPEIRTNWDTFERKEHIQRESNLMGSTYLPLDSREYAVFDRLAARGYIQTSFASLRPWTRLECARLLQEAKQTINDDGINEDSEARLAVQALSLEFSRELALLNGATNREALVESLYLRVGGISGTPSTDGFHFAQTRINDYGRPFGEGVDTVGGLSVRGSTGPFAFYVRGEYQYSPSTPTISKQTQDLIVSAGDSPVPAVRSTVSRFRPLEAYVALNLHDWQISFGKQSAWWGPGVGGALTFTNNAEPIPMLRVTRTSPLVLPGFGGRLGPVRSDFLLGRLGGHNFVRLGWPEFPLVGTLERPIDPQPYLWAYKVSFHPTENLEFGVSISTVFAGYGRPLTLETFKHTFSSSGNAQPIDPGDRRTGFDFRYRIPGLRKWLVLYNDSMAEDEPNPIAYPRRSAMNPGIYVPQIPKIPKMDFRAEGVYTNLPGLVHPGYFYSNLHYQNGYTNSGQIIGSWIGRQASGVQSWSRYWLTPTSTFQVGYRHQTVDPSFMKGGSLQDLSGSADFQVKNLQITSSLQFERWNFPGISPNPGKNVSVSIQLTYRAFISNRRKPINP